MTRGKRTISQEDLSSLLDGEIDPVRLDQVLRAIAERPDLVKQLEDDRRIANALERLNQDVLKEPLPKRIIELIEAHRRKHNGPANQG